MSLGLQEKYSVENALSKARRALEQSSLSLKWGVEMMAEAEYLGAPRDQIAKAVGKSSGWVQKKLARRLG